MVSGVTTGTDHAAYVNVAGPVLGVGTTTPTIGIPAAASPIRPVHHGIGAKEADAGFIADGNVEAELAAAIAEVGVAMASGTVATATAKAAHPNIYAGLIELVGEQQAVGLNNLLIAHPIQRDGRAIAIAIGVVGIDSSGAELIAVVAIERALEVRLSLNGIELIALEPERADRCGRGWFWSGDG